MFLRGEALTRGSGELLIPVQPAAKRGLYSLARPGWLTAGAAAGRWYQNQRAAWTTQQRSAQLISPLCVHLVPLRLSITQQLLLLDCRHAAGHISRPRRSRRRSV